ncbi:MAG TPA: gliding motility-associated C-terminal domain-containing protein, partial [Bacteroidia bacterium]|nr:gliding motility-associated C-terminal domain-containing protein [Bacteroidia bacterium]
SQQVNITQPSPLLAVVSSTTSACGICNGTASVAVSGGTSPYAYFWTPSNQTNPTATNLCVGSYTVTVTDAAGCTTTAIATINQVVNIIVTSSASSLSCSGACDGVASANASGGTVPYSYSWAPNGQTTQTILNQCAGSYTVTATDAAGCFNTATVTFIDPPPIVITMTNTNASCNGVCDGTATANASGGTGAYTYSWAPGGQTTQTATGLCAGTYTVTVHDANNCVSTETVTITEPTLITANAVSNPANCTLCDGSINTAASGGTGPYTYSWSPGAQTTPSISNLCPGIYSVTITDNTGCSVVIPISVSNINGPTVQATSTDATCNGTCDGTGNANVTGGASPFTYDWSPGNPTGDGTPNASGLCAGSYFCQVTDNVGCITFANITITQPTPVSANTSQTNISCNGLTDGSLSATGTGGTGPYTYNWLPGGQNTPAISGLGVGGYTVNITDANGCTFSQSFSITEPGPISASIASTNVQCFGACNGSATVTVVGGSSPYAYSWSSGQGTSITANLCPGSYTVDVTDVNGCTTNQSVTITQPTQLSTSISSTNVTCNALCNGTATVSASGGVGGYTYTWSPNGGTTPTASGLCAGAYSVITNDSNGCASVQSVTIQEPPAIVLSASSGPLSCNGSCNGVASVVASGGTPGYIYNWSPGGQTSASATSLCAGIYTVNVTDASGCSQTATTTVAQPAVLQANTSFTSPSCNNGTNGTASANPVGGTGPYSYLWAPGGQTTSTITGLSVGTYTVTVHDANGCQDVQTINVTAVSPIALTVASAPASCGNCDGTLSVTPSGGASPYTYNWSNALPNQPNQTNLCAGIYSVTVTDASGCANSFTLTMNNSGGPTGETVVSNDASCPASCDGSATVTPIGGAAPYTYVWNPGGQTTNSLTNMCAGSYFLQVTDTNGCIRFSPVTINAPQPINANPFVSNATCTGICDGSISLSPTGGTGPYSYSWSPGLQTTASITNQCIGTYTATITDANGCTTTSSSTINPWNTLAAVATSSNTTCSGSCNGTATATVTTGSGPFTYNWSDPLGQTTATATGLCPGSYTVVVADGAGCNTTLNVSLNSPTPITINPAVTPTTCGSCNGSVTLNTSGGIAPYTFQWSNGSTTSTLNGLCAGVYSVIIRDASGCTATYSVNISASGGPTAANATVTNATCNGTCNGSASLAPTGGTPPYSYLWVSGGQTTSSVNNLCAGLYFFQVRDSAGCALTDTVRITEPPPIVPNQTIVNTTCGICLGSISLNPSGGSAPYTYNWAPLGQTTSNITLLCAGLYTVTITDAAGCSITQPFPVSNSNSTLVLSTSVSGALCNDSCNGMASVSASGGSAPYTYSWSNGSTNDSITFVCAGTYLVQATDAGGCVSTASVNITEPSSLAGSYLFVQDELCTGVCNGFITAIPSGGTLPYTYNWSDAQTTQTASNLCAGSYTVVISDANGCSVTQNDSIISPVVLVPGVPLITDATCNNSADGAISYSVSGGSPPYTYSWTGPNGYTSASQNISGILPGNYTLTVTDANGCSISDTLAVGSTMVVLANAGNDTVFCQSGSILLNGTGSTNAVTYQWVQLPGMNVVGNAATATITPPPGATTYVLIVSNGACTDSDSIVVNSLPPPNADAGPDIEIFTGMNATIGGSPTGPPGSTFAWGPSTGLGDPTISNPVAAPGTTTTYTVVVTDGNGCTGSDTMTLTVVPSIEFPNGFSPNGDGINDVWVIDNIQLFPHCHVEVYNRWGEMLFASDGYNTPWDGRYQGKDLPVGTYYYIIKLNDPNFPDDYTGPITIMR